MRLQGRTAVITGAGSGIGRASALLFAQEGAQLALVDRAAQGLQETMTAIGADNRATSVHTGDVGDADFASAAVAAIVERHVGTPSVAGEV